MSDTNRNLTAKTLLLLGELAKAVGPAFENIARPLMATSVAQLSDNKSQASSVHNARPLPFSDKHFVQSATIALF